jgi:hypothetical protein
MKLKRINVTHVISFGCWGRTRLVGVLYERCVASIQNKLPFNLASYEAIKSCVELGEQDKGINWHYDSNYWSGAQML